METKKTPEMLKDIPKPDLDSLCRDVSAAAQRFFSNPVNAEKIERAKARLRERGLIA